MEIKASIKHLQINKANNLIMIVVAITTIATVFSLMSTKALLSQSSYQRKVLGERNKAIKELKQNISAANSLKEQYDDFIARNPNVLGGKGGTNDTKDEQQTPPSTPPASGLQNAASGPLDGDNAKITLDALPSQYDFPALISSIEKIITDSNITLQGIGGKDEGTGVNSEPGKSAQPISIDYSLTGVADYNTTLKLIKDFERSIRPFQVSSFTLQGAQKNMTMNILGNTYYQPSMSLKIGEKEVKK